MKVYLDNAATTQVDPLVIEEMTRVLKEEYGNPSSIHSEGRKAKNTIEQARKKIAGYIGASPGEIIFTSGGTEANNTALKCAVRDLGVTRIISTRLEHHCVGHSIERLASEGVTVDYLSLRPCGNIYLDELESKLQESDAKTLITIMYANNEVGTIYPWKEIAQLAKKYNAYYHADTVQAITHFPINVAEWPVHFISGAAHKFHGPKGIGFLYLNGDVSINCYIDGGAQERQMRAGTENIVGIVGMAKAMELACDELDERRAYITEMRNYMKDQLLQQFEGAEVNGPAFDEQLYTVLSVSFPPTDTSSFLLMQLDIKGICVSAGSACSSGSSKPSHVISSLRSEEDDYATIRFSFSHNTTKEEIDYTLQQLHELMPQPV